jgi:hypothetical protein
MSIVPPLISTTTLYELLFAVALIPSSAAEIEMVPSFIVTYVPSIPSAAVISNVPPSIVTQVVP